MSIWMDEWIESLHTINRSSGQGGNKLTTYRTFKFSYETEAYVTAILPNKHRSAFAKFRCWVAPIRLETGNLQNMKTIIPLDFVTIDKKEEKNGV
jgi:hypothetical protein